jgi:hypothetical protein
MASRVSVGSQTDPKDVLRSLCQDACACLASIPGPHHLDTYDGIIHASDWRIRIVIALPPPTVLCRLKLETITEIGSIRILWWLRSASNEKALPTADTEDFPISAIRIGLHWTLGRPAVLPAELVEPFHLALCRILDHTVHSLAIRGAVEPLLEEHIRAGARPPFRVPVGDIRKRGYQDTEANMHHVHRTYVESKEWASVGYIAANKCRVAGVDPSTGLRLVLVDTDRDWLEFVPRPPVG